MASKSSPVVSLEKIYADASGAPAIVEFDGMRFACDHLGSFRCNGLNGNRVPSKRVIARVRTAYLVRLRQIATPAWFANNAAMYAAE